MGAGEEAQQQARTDDFSVSFCKSTKSTGQRRAEQGRAGQGTTERSRVEQSRAEQGRAGQSRAEQGRAEQGRAQQSRAESEQNRVEPGSSATAGILPWVHARSFALHRAQY